MYTHPTINSMSIYHGARGVRTNSPIPLPLLSPIPAPMWTIIAKQIPTNENKYLQTNTDKQIPTDTHTGQLELPRVTHRC